MKFRTRLLVIAAAIVGLIGIGVVSAPYVYAAATMTVTSADTVAAGQTIAFAATASDGTSPTNQRITWFANGRNYNVANSSVISKTYDPVSGAYLFTYRPDVSEIGRLETFSVQTGCTRLGCTVTGYKTFTVTG